MNSGLFDSNAAYGPDWETGPDTSEFIFDSPVPHNQDLFSSTGQPSNSTQQQQHGSAVNTAAIQQNSIAGNQSQLQHSAPNAAASQQPATSPPSNSQSSSSESPSQLKHTLSASPRHISSFTSGGPGSAQGLQTQSPYLKMENMFGEDSHPFGMDSTFPSVNSDMEDLSIETGAGLDFASTGPSLGGIFTGSRDHGINPSTIGAMRNAQALNVSPQQMTVSPKKMFSLESREDSPNDQPMNSGQSSPFLMNNNSPLSGNAGALGTEYSSESRAGKYGSFSRDNTSASKSGMASNEDANETIPPSGLTQPALTKKWPCELLVDPTPEKSRVETQIPIKLTLRNPPAGCHRLHLPGYTISKPKFQQKPIFEGDEETLELSVLLVCASAMRTKEGAIERAFTRAESEQIPVREKESSPGMDDSNPKRPLNGGPVTICPGCIVRERKRANRKKNKKQEEEEEWQKDEAKRVIVFNCPEIKDWCVTGTKETPVKDHGGPVESIFVNAPMRIACYCRHQSEKIGFQVIFTVRRPNGEILAQGISQSIMITDDHKQPPASAAVSAVYNNQPEQQQPTTTQGMFQQNPTFNMYGQAQNFGASTAQDLPFRPSFSVPNLSQMAHQYSPHNGHGFPRQFSSNNLSSIDSSQGGNNSVSVTPRTLSRPASPTNPAGQPGTKKRRSAGGSGHHKVPSGLSMTKIDTNRSPPASNGPLTSASNSTGFNFQSPTSSSFATTPLDGAFPMQHQHMRTLSAAQAFQGQATPQHMAFGAGDPDLSQFYSAPTSQHQSRAPSPSQVGRFAQHATYAHQMSQGQLAALQASIPSQAAAALSSLPVGINIHKPPIIQRMIPAAGTRNGGQEVTVLGSGFFQGLEVMFGDAPALNTTFWGETTLVCTTPPLVNHQAGPVDVVFRHQHHRTPNNVQNMQALMPSRHVQFLYQSEPFGPHLGNTSGGMPTGMGAGMSSAHGAGSPIGSPGMDDGSGAAVAGPGVGSLGGMQSVPRSFFTQQTSPGHTPPRQMPGSGSAGFNPAAQARRQPLSRTMSGDAGAFRRVG